MSSRTALIVTFWLVAATAACGTHNRVESASAHRETPISDLAGVRQYWCDLVPRQALRLLTDTTGKINEFRDGSLAKQGLCLVRDDQRYGAISVSWDTSAGPQTVQRQAEAFAQFDPKRLPATLGYGFETKLPYSADHRPYYGIVSFACGGARPWLRISLRDVRAGRDYVRDLEELLRIAEGRFGELHGCRPGPV
jgi:hypothetical protein